MPVTRWPLHCRWLVVLLIGVVALLAGGEALAHATLVERSIDDGATLPTSPSELVLRFSEPVALAEDAITLFASGLDPVPLEASVDDATVSVPLPDRGEGAFLVQWRVLSQDGHPVSGTVRYQVGDAGARNAVTDVPATSRWGDVAHRVATGGLYITMLAALGTMVVGRIIASADVSAIDALARVLTTLAMLAALIVTITSALVRRGSASTSLSDLLQGVLDLPRSQLALPLLLVAALLLRRYPAAIALLALSSTGTLVFTGHTQSTEPVWAMMLADVIHLGSAAVWLGGLIVLMAGLSGRWLHSSFADAQRPVAQFSAIMAGVVVALAVSGVFMAWRVLESWRALIDTAYGRVLLAKIALVLLVLLLATANRFWLLPARSLAWVRRLVLCELALLLAISGVTGHLVNLNPHAASAATTVLYDGHERLTDDLTLSLVITERDAVVHVQMTVLNADGAAVAPVDPPTAAWTLTSPQIGPIDMPLTADGDGFTADIALPMRGQWTLAIDVRTDRFTIARVSVPIDFPHESATVTQP